MNSPLKGGSGIPGCAGYDDAQIIQRERKRRGRNVDVIVDSLPTPSHRSHLPTPETIRRIVKSPNAKSSTTQLPTPQTQRRRRRLSPDAEHENPHPTSSPSPSGHTTFFLSSSTSTSRPEKIRRRPGLTFAQQMGLISNNPRGVGVGMGGQRSSVHGKVDQIPSSILQTEENPFLVRTISGQVLGDPAGIASPGFNTIHHPDDDHESDDELMAASPIRALRRSPRLASPSPSTNITKSILPFATSSGSGLLSPPPTQHAARIGVLTSGGRTRGLTREQMAERERQKRELEDKKRMLDFVDNPFLVKPGEPSTRRPGPIVDEDRSTVTYVFRGARKIFANPLYPSRAPFPAAELEPADEEFEPHPLPKPKLLWPTGPSPSKTIKRYPTRTPSPDNERSPPSSPVSTPTLMNISTTSRVGQGRFATLARVHSSGGGGGGLQGPEDVFTDDEIVIGHDHDHEDEDEDDEDHIRLPSRRGMLFGAAGKGGMKRTLDAHEERERERRVKKAKSGGASRL